MPDQKQRLKARIKKLQNEVIESVRQYLYQHRMNQESYKQKTDTKQNIDFLKSTTPQTNKEQNKIDDIQQEQQSFQQNQTSVPNKYVLNNHYQQMQKPSQQQSAIVKRLDYNVKSQHQSQNDRPSKDDLQITIKKQKNLQRQLSQLKENKDKIVDELTSQIQKLTKQNQSYREQAQSYYQLLEEFREKYGRNSEMERQKQKQSQFLMEQLDLMEKKRNCARCGSDDLQTKLAIYVAKNQLMINAINESEQKNYQLHIQIQELNNIIQSKQQHLYPNQELPKNKSLCNFNEVSQTVFQTICNLPLVTAGLQKHQEVLFEPENEQELKSAVVMLKRFSQAYQSINQLKQKQFQQQLDKIFQVIKIIVQVSQISAQKLDKILIESDFNGDDKFGIGYRIHQLVSNKGSIRDIQKDVSKPEIRQKS